MDGIDSWVGMVAGVGIVMGAVGGEGTLVLRLTLAVLLITRVGRIGRE